MGGSNDGKNLLTRECCDRELLEAPITTTDSNMKT